MDEVQQGGVGDRKHIMEMDVVLELRAVVGVDFEVVVVVVYDGGAERATNSSKC